SIPDRQMTYLTDGGEKLLAADLEEMEKKLSDNGMPAECVFELQYKLTASFGDNVCKAVSMQGAGTTADEYTYTRGVPPESADELAVTDMTADQLGAAIGDTIKIHIGSEEREFIITGLFQSMNNLGEGIRLHEDAEIPFSLLCGTCSYQVNFTDNPDDEETEKRIEKLEELYPEANSIHTSGEVVAETTGVADTLSLVRNLIAVIAAIIIVLVSVLMERSMIAKEQGEIAVLKAIGFRDASIISWHTKRFIITACISAVIAVALVLPVTSLVINPVFAMMGASEGVEYTMNIPEVFIAYPLALIAVMALSVMFTSIYTKKITASQTADIE
ncbi:MAG: FtsX-like permease family protein, partial [Porcipelethomonas sp.]